MAIQDLRVNIHYIDVTSLYYFGFFSVFSDFFSSHTVSPKTKTKQSNHPII